MRIEREGMKRVGVLTDPAGRALLRRAAKIAGVSYADARRHFTKFAEDAKSEDERRVINIDLTPLAKGDSIAIRDDLAQQAAKQLAQQIGLGRFGRPQREPLRQPKEKIVTIQHHPYVKRVKGRSIRAIEHGKQVATVQCSKCPNKHEITFRTLCHSDQIDRKFIQDRWRLDPPICPACQEEKGTKMGTAPSPAAIKAQAKMFNLINTHFDPEQGVYAAEWNDARIAKEAGLSVEQVAAVREEAFGALKQPEEITELAGEISLLEQRLTTEAAELTRLIAATLDPIKSDLGALKQRAAELRRKFGA